MAGIYIHIPFCKSKCNYCDFYSIVNKNESSNYLNALICEIENKSKNFVNSKIRTIYFGGGTPSILSISQIEKILIALSQKFDLSETTEITFEANPEDLSVDYLNGLKSLPINRISIGLQSLDNTVLKHFMNRRHDSGTALKAVVSTHNAGFENISVDIIYGYSGLTKNFLQETLEILTKLPITHISAYHLSIAEGTPLHKNFLDGFYKNIDDEESFEQFCLISNYLNDNKFEHYEISNFAKAGYKSVHNCSYWEDDEYLGIGSSAHSFMNEKRYWNVSDVSTYIRSVLKNDGKYFDYEELSDKDKYNEYLIKRLRTAKGISLDDMESKFGSNLTDSLIRKINKLNKSLVIIKNRNFRLSLNGLFISNHVLSKLIE